MLDLLVIGGGPAGLATATHAARRGLRVRVLEAREGTLDKACGEGLMPGALEDLRDLVGELPEHHPFQGIRYIQGHDHVEADFPAGAGAGIRRTTLHAALRRAADDAGAERLTHRAQRIHQHADHVDVDGQRARWLIAADGLRSPTRDALGLTGPSRWPNRVGVRRHARIQPWSPYVEVWWSPHAEAYVTPVAPDQVGVAFLFSTPPPGTGSPWARLLALFPELQERLAGAPFSSAPAGAGPFAVASTARVQGRALLVGDAAGYLDPLTGEGLRLGFRQAVGAVDAVIASDPAAYERAWQAVWRPYAFTTGALLHITRPALTRRLLVPTLRRLPFLMRAVLHHLAS